MPGSFTLHSLLEFAQIVVHWVSDASLPFHPLPAPFYFAFYLLQHQGLFNQSVLLIKWLKYWSFSFSIHTSKEYSGFLSFRIEWFDFLEVQGTPKGLLQHLNSKASILRWCSFSFLSIRKLLKSRLSSFAFQILFSEGFLRILPWTCIHLRSLLLAYQHSPTRVVLLLQMMNLHWHIIVIQSP